MEFKIVDIDDLVPNPFQPREEFDKESIGELADSIKSVGEIQPIIVRKQKKGGYQIIAGERRWRAAKFARLTEVPVLIKDTAEENVLLESLIENLHRKDLESVERENAIYDLWKTGRWKTQSELGKALGKTNFWVGSNISAALLRREEKIPADVSTRMIDSTAALEKEERRQIIEKVRREEIPEKDVREFARVVKEASPTVKEAIFKPKTRITP
jgi:ParB family chromosome partitioning protein